MGEIIMRRCLIAVVLCLGLTGIRAIEEVDRAGTSSTSGSDDLVCIVIRTFWGHGKNWGDDSLRTLLQSLQNQNHTRCERAGKAIRWEFHHGTVETNSQSQIKC